jgi:hypothetical protein
LLPETDDIEKRDALLVDQLTSCGDLGSDLIRKFDFQSVLHRDEIDDITFLCVRKRIPQAGE